MTTTAMVRLVACGSVDDGKSTLIGRLLVQTDSIPDDQVEAARRTRRGGSIVPEGEVDYSLVTDGLEAEREQGITIDVAYRHLNLRNGRRVVIADAPGHEQYTRNMAVAASNADIAFLLVDAARGVRPQTHRHLTVCALMGVRSIVLAINKLDAVGFEQSAFDALVEEVMATARRLDLADVSAIPVSALDGDNVVDRSERTAWYDGPTVLEYLEQWTPAAPAEDQPLRVPVQLITRAENDFRGYAGTVVSGSVRPGDKVVVADSGISATVDRLVTFDGDLDEAVQGDAVTITLKEEVDVRRGDVISGAADFAQPADRFAADLVWTGDEPMAHGRSYLLQCGPRTVPATVTTVRHRLDVTTGDHTAARLFERNEIGRVEIATDVPVPLDPYDLSRDTGGFLLIDRVTSETVAAGMVRFALRRSFNVVEHDFVVDREARNRHKGHPSRVMWLTGLSGSGKSTIADAVESSLLQMGVHAYVLDGDTVRHGLTKDLGFTPEDRAENVRRVAETAKLMVDAGLVVLVALVSPFRADREAARELFDEGDFLEAYVDTPVEVCAERDPKGLYAKAKDGSLPNLTGVGQEYEPPRHADLVLDGTAEVLVNAERVVRLLLA